MPVEMRAVTPYKPRYPVVDVHGHGYRNPRRFQEVAARYGVPLYGSGSIGDARESMQQTGIARQVVKNFAKGPGAVRAANDFAIEVAREHQGHLLPTGTIHPAYDRNEEEIERLAEAGIRGIAFDSCWQGFAIDDSRLREAYRKVSGYGMFILTHTGVDLGAPHSTAMTWPQNVLAVREMAPDSKIIAAHLGANFAFGRSREYVGSTGILFDLAWVVEMYRRMPISASQILDIIGYLGSEQVVYGSDYPWADPGSQLMFWESLFADSAWGKISHKNAVRELGIEVGS